MQFNGDRFHDNGASNTFRLVTGDLQGSNGDVTLQGNVMNDQDEFRSEPEHSGKLSWTIADFNEIGAQAGLATDWYNSYHSINMQAKVTHGQEVHGCRSASRCNIVPNWDYTPISYGISPKVLYYGQKVTYIVNPGLAGSNQLDSTFLHHIDIKIDDVQLDMRPYLDESVTASLTE